MRRRPRSSPVIDSLPRRDGLSESRLTFLEDTEGVTFEEVDNPAYMKALKRSAKNLAKDMRATYESM